ncbi:hypothetical protein U1Q18_043069 [Sarracenia purpurea var. burkii]
MDGRGGCCIARYPAGGAYDLSSVDQIMLRFRPIAPSRPRRPAGSASGGSSVKKNEVYCRGGRGKRRPLRKKLTGAAAQFIPEKPWLRCRCCLRLGSEGIDGQGVSVNFSDLNTVKQADSLPIWLNFSNSDEKVNNEIVNDDITSSGAGNGTPVVIPQPVRVLGSIVTVECVMETGGEGYGGLGARTKSGRRV